jgi:hypothetical protein
VRGEAGMTVKEHLIYFYRFSICGVSSSDLLINLFQNRNSKDNSLQLRTNYILFIADKKIDDNSLIGRIIKINVGLYKRINMTSGDEWLEQIKKENGLEFETYVFINLKDQVMAATYNSNSFGIFDSSIQKYFDQIFKMNIEDCIKIIPLALPNDIKKLLKSKHIRKAEFKLNGDEVRELQDATGEGPAGIILGDKENSILGVDLTFKYREDKKPIGSMRKLINYFTSKYRSEKEYDENKQKIDEIKEKVIIETETGHYSLIRRTLLNDLISYDDQSEEDRTDKVFKELSNSIEKNDSLIKEAIEISEKELGATKNQKGLDDFHL